MREFGVGHPGIFTFDQLRRWFASEYPAVQEASLRTHLAEMTAQPHGRPGRLPWLFERVGHGEYRYNPATSPDPMAAPPRRSETSIWELLDQCTSQLGQTFSRAAIVDWFRRNEPDVRESSLAAHIQEATVTVGRSASTGSKRQPFLVRVEHGRYRRKESERGNGPGSASLEELSRELDALLKAIAVIDEDIAGSLRADVARLGIPEAIEQTVRGSHASAMFRRLWNLGRLDLTLEALVTSSTNAGVFGSDVQRQAQGRLAFYSASSADTDETQPILGSVVLAVPEDRRQARSYRVESIAGGVTQGREFWYSGTREDDGACVYSEHTRRLVDIRDVRDGAAPIAGRRRSEQPEGTYGR
jgi:hypothetical protein